MKYFDVHTHTNYTPLDGQSKEIADECKNLNISYIDIGTDVNTSALAVKHSLESTNVYACIGIHPNDTDKIDIDIALAEINSLLNEHKTIVGVGETGLDYHYLDHNKEQQKQVFIQHIALAHKYQLPLMVHVRDAHDDVLEILQAHAKGLKIIIHCFTGNVELVKKYVDLGCYISINGVITFKSTKDLRDAIKEIPLNLLLSETDAPWLSPEPYRGKVNTPLNVPIVVKAIAKVLNMKIEDIAKQLYDNAVKLFLSKIIESVS